MFDKISKEISINVAIRNAKLFTKNRVLRPALKLFAIMLLALILIILGIKLIKPSYYSKIQNKAHFYFFHFLRLDNKSFDQINISGNKRVTEDEIIDIINDVQKKSNHSANEDYQPLIHSIMNRIKSELPWVNQVIVTRNMPNTLNVSVIEYEPFAIWESEGRKYLTDKDGNLLPYEDSEEFKNMVILSGYNANLNTRSLFNIFAVDAEFGKNIYSATWISDRRWDIRLENGIIIKLPEKDISEAWNNLIKIYNMSGSVIGLQVIDLRIPQKVYLEYNDSVIKELKNL